MTVANGTSAVSYTGNGATTVFPVTFRFLANATVVVTLAGVPQTEGTHYTLAGAGEASGSLTMLTAPATAAELLIRRVVPLTQPTAFRSQGSFSPSLHEDALDRSTFAAQQIAREVEALTPRVADAEAAAADLTGRVTAVEVQADATQAQLAGLVLDVAEVQLADLSVTTAKLAAGAVTTAKLADGAITTAKRAALNIQTSAEVTFTSSESYIEVTGLTVTITSTGRPLVVALIPSAAYSGYESFLRIYKQSGTAGIRYAQVAFDANGSGTPFAAFQLSAWLTNNGDWVAAPPGTCHTVWTPAPGVHEISVLLGGVGGTPGQQDATLNRVKLVAYEL